jgi:hypothetical protein
VAPLSEGLLSEQAQALASSALYAAAVERKVSDEDYVGYHWRRFLHDEVIMRGAAGSVWRRGWPPIR